MSPYLENVDMDIGFSQLVSDNESNDGLSLIDEDELLHIEEVDIYLYEGLPSELHLDELSDLSDNEEFRDEKIEEPEQSGMSAGLKQQFALCLTTLQRPFQPANIMDLSAAIVDGVDSEPQELNFYEGDLIESPFADPPSTANPPADVPSIDAPTAASAADSPDDLPRDESPETDPPTDASAADLPEDEPAVMQGCDPAMLYVEEKELNKRLEKLPFPPLPATKKKWRERQASPAMKEFIQKIKEHKIRVGKDNHRIFLPYNLRDKLIAMRGRKLAEGPYANRKLLIDEYRLRKERQQWNSLA